MPSRHLVRLFACLALCSLALPACNLPARVAPVVPTNQPVLQPTLELLSFPTAAPTVAASPSPQPTQPGVEPTPQPSPTLVPGSGLQTATAGPVQTGTWNTPVPEMPLPPFTYWTQVGDTLSALAARFGVLPEQINAAQLLPAQGLLPPGLQLTIPTLVGEPPYPSALLPDNLVVYSPAVASFDIAAYIAQAGGYLNTYGEYVDADEWLSGAQIVQRVAGDSSVNPQLLLAFLEFRSGWVRGQPSVYADLEHPIGFYVPEYTGLYLELSLAAKHLNIGYYGWRQGSLLELTFPTGARVRLSPALNAGSVALQSLTAKFYLRQEDWLRELYGPDGLTTVFTEMFGDPWQAASREPLFPPGLAQPMLELPFQPGEYWSLTSGPHIAWTTGTPRGALDFAPITGEPACAVSVAWVTASAPGLVVRAERGIVAIDLDGDGRESTGWVLVYMHIAEKEHIPLGAWVQTDDQLGHPSCEGGSATGTHVHLARKFNGEWLAAESPLPMVLSGWTAHAGELSYQGTLEKDGRVVTAQPNGTAGSTIIR
jgi:murein DD-endopeptidase MepM/ murein hydrolase activator NlpD